MTLEDPDYAALGDSFSAIAQLLFVESTLRETLQRVVDAAHFTVEGCDAASVSLHVAGRLATAAFTDSVAFDTDQFQHLYDEGPYIDAVRDEPLIYAPDLTDESRWPRFAPAAVALGMRCLLSCRFSAQSTLGALNLYARTPNAFDALDRARAIVFAAHASVALGVAGDLRDIDALLNVEIVRSAHLEEAIASREIVGQAQGILIEREKMTADAAYDTLVKTSQALNLKLRNVAQYIVDTGDVPSV